MKSYRKELWFNVATRMAFINITPQVEECLKESGIKEGLVLINAMHITSSVFIEIVVAVTDGNLDFGPWEQIFSGLLKSFFLTY